MARIARAWATLMARLGYHRYGALGNDWGWRAPWSRWSEPLRGGHFPALEQPEVFTAEVEAFFDLVR